MLPCESATVMAVAPAAAAPAMAALTSPVMSFRKRSYSNSPGPSCAAFTTPVMPSMSAEMNTRSPAGDGDGVGAGAAASTAASVRPRNMSPPSGEPAGEPIAEDHDLLRRDLVRHGELVPGHVSARGRVGLVRGAR